MAEAVEGDGGEMEPEVEANDARDGGVGLTKAEERLLKPGGCRAYMRRTLAKEFKGIVEGFVAAAKTGSVPHVKLVTELLRPTRKGTTRIKGPAARFFEKLEKEKLERERLKAEKQ